MESKCGEAMKKYKHHNGFSLVEVLVTVGVISIMGLAMATMMSSLERQNKALGQKLESIELEQSLNRILVDNASCGCLFDYPAWTTGTPEINLTHLKKGCSADNLLATDTSIYTNSQLKVETIKLKNITPFAGSGTISGDVEIVLKNGVNSMKPIRIPGLRFSPDDITTPTKIAGCVGVAGAETMCTGMGGTWKDGKCQLPMMATAISTSDCIAQYGVGWTWNGSACAPPAQACPAGKVGAYLINAPLGSQGELFTQSQVCGSSYGTWQCLNGVWKQIKPFEECAG